MTKFKVTAMEARLTEDVVASNTRYTIQLKADYGERTLSYLVEVDSAEFFSYRIGDYLHLEIVPSEDVPF